MKGEPGSSTSATRSRGSNCPRLWNRSLAAAEAARVRSSRPRMHPISASMPARLALKESLLGAIVDSRKVIRINHPRANYNNCHSPMCNCTSWMRHRTRVYPSSAISLSKSATADLDAQARNPVVLLAYSAALRTLLRKIPGKSLAQFDLAQFAGRRHRHFIHDPDELRHLEAAKVLGAMLGRVLIRARPDNWQSGWRRARSRCTSRAARRR